MIDLKARYGHIVKVSLAEGETLYKPENQVIKGKFGEISPYDNDTVDLWLLSTRLAKKLERLGWPVRNHYDDGAAFLIKTDRILEAFEIIKAKRRKRLSKETLKRLKENMARINSKRLKHGKTGVLRG